ncbi:sugar ABC transporter substrate-binding protein [Isoptericola sp. BMS4]|uniref:ABC transporter substrate-binding protein n=1 Tax=Isoptericola sp. BMS4 TaxID=2527875 RepID=UPI00141F1D91|nr:sugar ABC transporter substrate-binding protein [Isoptericola sp. BMS4]
MTRTTQRRTPSTIRRGWTAALAAGSLGALAACGGGADTGGAAPEPEEGAASGSVTMWTYPVIADEAAHKAFWDDKIAEFTAENPDVDVTVEIYPWSGRDETLATAIAGGKAPDVVYLIPDQLPKYAKSLAAVDNFVADQSAGLRENAKAAVTVDGDMLGSPLLMNAKPLVCNAEAFEKIGESGNYPATWDDLMALAPKFQDAGYDVTNYWGAVDATLNESFYPLLWQAGGSVFSEDGTAVAFNSAEGVEALQFATDLAQGGYVEQDLLTTIPAFEQTHTAQGKIACTWQQGPGDVASFWGEENVVVLPPLSKAESIGYGTVGGLSLMNTAEDTDAAGKWLAFATSDAVSAEYAKAAGWFGPYSDQTGLYEGDELMTALEGTLDATTAGDLNEKSREVMGVLAPEIQAALIGEKTPEQALDDAAAAAEPLLR